MVEVRPDSPEAVLGFGGKPRLDSPITPAGPDGNLPMSIQVYARDDSRDTATRGKTPTGHIAGHEVWYFTDTQHDGLG